MIFQDFLNLVEIYIGENMHKWGKWENAENFVGNSLKFLQNSSFSHWLLIILYTPPPQLQSGQAGHSRSSQKLKIMQALGLASFNFHKLLGMAVECGALAVSIKNNNIIDNKVITLQSRKCHKNKVWRIVIENPLRINI